MEGYSRKEEGCHQFLDLIPKGREWVEKKSSEAKIHGVSEEKKLELRLGPPREEDWIIKKQNISQNNFNHFSDNLNLPWQQQTACQFLHLQSQPCSNREAGDVKNSDKNTFSASTANTAVPHSQKRTAPSPMVGWPPIRSFRKNFASGSSSKLASDSGNVVENKDLDSKPKESSPKTLFVKINMDGIPIGRKVDLKAYDSYEKLSHGVDELFGGLLAAQSDGGAENEGGKLIGGILNGNREYTLVYEDNEGDRMLVGDVPWHMFISTVKRLRVLKSSELPTLSRGSKQRKQLPFDPTM